MDGLGNNVIGWHPPRRSWGRSALQFGEQYSVSRRTSADEPKVWASVSSSTRSEECPQEHASWMRAQLTVQRRHREALTAEKENAEGRPRLGLTIRRDRLSQQYGERRDGHDRPKLSETECEGPPVRSPVLG